MRSHTVFNCDKCGKVPSPNEFYKGSGHFIILIKLPNGSYGEPRVTAGKNLWTFARLGTKLKKNSIAVCRECLLAPSKPMEAKDVTVLDAEIIEPSVTD